MKSNPARIRQGLVEKCYLMRTPTIPRERVVVVVVVEAIKCIMVKCILAPLLNLKGNL
jgi:hypothetical protein